MHAITMTDITMTDITMTDISIAPRRIIGGTQAREICPDLGQQTFSLRLASFWGAWTEHYAHSVSFPALISEANEPLVNRHGVLNVE